MAKKKVDDFSYKVKKTEGAIPWFLGLIGLVLVIALPIAVIYFGIQYFSK